jgi:hypothetical protein
MKYLFSLSLLLNFCLRLFAQPNFCAMPVASFPFNGNANDISGNGNHGVLGGQSSPGPALTTDRFGNPNSAYLFGGYDDKDWIKVPNSPSLQFDKQMTISLWFKQCSFEGMNGWGMLVPNGFHILFSKAGDGIAADPGFYSGTSTNANGLMSVGFNNVYNADMAIDTTFTCFDTCEWVHYVLVVDSNLVKIYFNGNLQKSKVSTNTNFNNANNRDFFLGRMNGGGIIWYPYNGIIDDVNIYNCALSSIEVQSLYGNYSDPLLDEYSITIDSISVSGNQCIANSQNVITVFANQTGAPYEYSLDGLNWQNPNVFNGLVSGTYGVKIRNKCSTKDTIVEIISPILLSDTVLLLEAVNCNTLGRIGVLAKGGLTPFQYNLNNGSWQNSGTFENLSVGFYQLTIRDANGCEVQRSFDITDLSSTVSIIQDSVDLVVDCIDTSAFVALHPIGGTPLYYYSLDGGAFQFQGVFRNLITGNHTIIVKDSFGCQSLPFNFTVIDNSLNYSIFDTIRICNGEIYQVGNSIYSNSGEYIDIYVTQGGCDSIVYTSLTVYPKMNNAISIEICKGDSIWISGGYKTLEGMYFDTLLNVNGCDSVLVSTIIYYTSEYCDSINCRVYIPNVFSSAGNSENSKFLIHSPVVEIQELWIYDRWGDLVFHSDKMPFEWDGKSSRNQELVNSAVYIFVAKGQCQDGKIIMKTGDILFISK